MLKYIKASQNNYCSTTKSVILNYHDSIVRACDLDLLCGPFWLNDAIIGFYLEYLEKEIYSDSNVCFIRPEVLQCLKFSPPSELDVFLGPLEFKEKEFAIMPLNNCDVPDKVGGSHWSVLIYSKSEGTFFHVDSLFGTNDNAAKQMTKILSNYLGIGQKMEVISSVQQGNSYDCGVYVLRFCELLLEYIKKNNKVANIGLMEAFDVPKKRFEVRQLIENLAA